MQNFSQMEAEMHGYTVEYEHDRFSDGSWLTTCTLSREGKPTTIGLAICSPRDNFDRKKGNIISCGRALKATSLRVITTASPMQATEGSHYCQNDAFWYAYNNFGAKSIRVTRD